MKTETGNYVQHQHKNWVLIVTLFQCSESYSKNYYQYTTA